MNLKGTTLENLNKISCKVENPNKSEDYQFCVKAYALSLNENYEESINCYEKALKIDRNNIEALKGISHCYKKTEKYNLAIKYYKLIKFLKPFDRTVHYELGTLEYENKQYVKAIKHFINAIKLSPEYYDAIYALGQSHEAIEEFEMAEMIYLKIISNRPSYLMAYNRLANLYIKLEDYKKATRYFREILAINPEFHKAYLGIAIACDNSGNTIEAKRYYKKYLEKKPFSADRSFILQRLEKMRNTKKAVTTNVPYLKVIK